MSSTFNLRVISQIALALVCAALALVATAPYALAASPSHPSLSGKWKLGEFTLDGGFDVRTAMPLPPQGVAFPFLDRPDTIFLITDSPAYEGRLLGDLTGETLTARVGVDATPGTEFTYFGDPDGSGKAANVRLYFETDISLGPIVCPCQDKGWSSFWYSNPVSVDLESLKAGDVTLSVELDPSLWADGQETPGNADETYRSFFAQAVAHVDDVGLTFGGGRHFHNGVGVVPGTGSAAFRLMSYDVVTP